MGLTIKIYDVEHGSCTQIITPNNRHILIDVGSKMHIPAHLSTVSDIN